MDITKKLKASSLSSATPMPQFFDLSNKKDVHLLDKLLTEKPNTRIINTYDDQLKEWFVLQNPSLYQDKLKRDKEFNKFCRQYYAGKLEHEVGLWVYLPWRDTLLHLLEDDKFHEVRTGRNRNLITPDEQKKYYNSVIGIAGQSVGNSCTLAIVLTGGGKHMRLADPDTLELTNLNRIRGSIAEITNLKVNMTAHQIYELDPYAKLELFSDGITEENIEAFFDGPPKLDIVIDEMDNLGLKIRLRQEAKKRKIPVLMAADNGDSAILDVERHDLEDDIAPFHGRAGEDIAEQVLNKNLPLPAMARIIGDKIIGFDVHEQRLIESLLAIGDSIPTWPQLGTAATLNGVLVAVAVRKILNHQPLINNRAIVSMPNFLEPNYNDPEETQKRQQKLQELGQEFIDRIEKLADKNPD